MGTLWTLGELTDGARELGRRAEIPEGCTVAVQADVDAQALLLVGRPLSPAGAGPRCSE